MFVFPFCTKLTCIHLDLVLGWCVCVCLFVCVGGCRSGRLKIGSLQTLVLDEFDALLEYKPHRDPTRAIVETLKRRHGQSLQSVLCSATATDMMNSVQVKDLLRPGYETAMADDNDVLVTEFKRYSNETGEEDGHSTPKAPAPPQVSRTVLHGVVHLEHRRFALEAIRRILHTEPSPQQILIFVENARKVDIVVNKLADRGIIAAPLHGGSGSEKMDRAEVSRALRQGYVGIVVATEMAARGLDAPLLTHVINMDLPTDASHYAHRAGRCGRGGRPGVVINITTSPKERNVPKRFANQLGIDLYSVEARTGQLMMIDPDTQVLDSM
jgi:superfamily II DNA/RNA helicase